MRVEGSALEVWAYRVYVYSTVAAFQRLYDQEVDMRVKAGAEVRKDLTVDKQQNLSWIFAILPPYRLPANPSKDELAAMRSKVVSNEFRTPPVAQMLPQPQDGVEVLGFGVRGLGL